MTLAAVIPALSIRFAALVARFRQHKGGAVAVEMAFIVPILATLGFVAFDAAAVIKARERAVYAYYTIGDAVSSATGNVNCDYLDRLGLLAFRGYYTGNWGARDKVQTWLYDDRGAEDWRFQIRGLKVQMRNDPGADPNNLKARVIWAYYRTQSTTAGEAQAAPGRLVNIPREYQLPGEFYIYVEGRHYVEEPIGAFDLFTTEWKEVKYDSYFSPRYVPVIDLNRPYRSGKCLAD